jgi:hypothetical protein
MIKTGLSKDQVKEYSQIFLEAVEWYSKNTTQKDQESGSNINDPKYSLLFDLKRNIESGEQMFDEVMIRLLRQVLRGFLNHLSLLKDKQWANQKVVMGQIAKLEQFDRDCYKLT